MTTQERLYTNFMDDPIVYDAMQMVWYDLLHDLALEHEFTYRPYLNSLLPNGEKDRDANPIFNTYLPASSRAVRIIQIPNSEEQATPIQGYLNVFGDEEYEDEIIDELVIHLVYSETSRIIARNWMRAWLVDGVEKGEMERRFEEQNLLLNTN
jgi:hypothetical protein